MKDKNTITFSNGTVVPKEYLEIPYEILVEYGLDIPQDEYNKLKAGMPVKDIPAKYTPTGALLGKKFIFIYNAANGAQWDEYTRMDVSVGDIYKLYGDLKTKENLYWNTDLPQDIKQNIGVIFHLFDDIERYLKEKEEKEISANKKAEIEYNIKYYDILLKILIVIIIILIISKFFNISLFVIATLVMILMYFKKLFEEDKRE